jgi:uncharacterized protein involved in response to NO
LSAPAPEPYRALFPFGAAYALVGAALWPLHALGWIPYPGPAHAAIMLEGFELGFVAGFALTVIPRFTRTGPVGPGVVRAAQALALVFGLGWAIDRPALAHTAFLLALGLVAAVAFDRLRRRQNDPPEEAVFLFTGVVFGLVGAALLVAQSLGLWEEPSPRFAARLLSLGMALALVLGMGGLLVPVFLGIKDPLVIPRVAGAHERPARRALYAVALIALAASFAADATGRPGLGAWTRAAVAGCLVLGVWKTWRRPRAWSGPAALLWASGWCVLAGLVGAALFPLHATGLLHLVFLGGYGALTLGIATRVVVTHGGHAVDRERVLVPVGLVVALGLALVLRLLAEAEPLRAQVFWAISGTLWIAVWAWWLARAFGLPTLRQRSTP